MRVLVIGGTGSFSTRVTQNALERGHDVLVYARGRRLPEGLAARMRRADRADLRAQAGELAAFAPDIEGDSICFDPARAEDLVAPFGAARRVALISSVDVHGEDVGCAPVSEARPPAPVSPDAQAKLSWERAVPEGLRERATVFDRQRPCACDRPVARLGHAPIGTPEPTLEQTVQHGLHVGLVKDAAEQPYDDALVALLARHAAELGELLASRAAPR